MSDYNNGYDEGYRAGMQKVREVGQARIEELEAELTKALEFIEDLTGCEWPYCEDAKRVLAELSKERSDEKGQDVE